MGKVIKTVDVSNYNKLAMNAEKIFDEDDDMDELYESPAFGMIRLSKKYDDWCLDPFVGLFLPGFGDMLSALITMPALYVSLFKLHSFKLFLAILVTVLLDLVFGLIPVVGDIVDVFFKSNRIASRLIMGYIEDDGEVMEEINQRALWGFVALLVLGAIIYACFSLIMGVYHWIAGLF